MRGVKGLDLFRKVSGDLSSQTSIGGTITLIALISMGTLFVTETIDYLSVSIRKETLVDQDRGSGKLPINFNITFPHAPCHLVSLDYMDSVGNHVLDVKEVVNKVRLDASGNVISEPFETSIESMIQALNNGEGCRTEGTIKVVKVPGNFHISFHAHHDKIHRLGNSAMSKVSFAHTIHHLSFGPGMLNQSIVRKFGQGSHTNFAPYDGLAEDAQRGVAIRHEYYISIVPIQYCNEVDHSENYSYQFSMSSYNSQIRSLFGAVWFRYEIESVTMKYVLEDKSFAKYLVNLCAILGGIFAVLGVVHSLLQQAIKIKK
jgi:hypothetical protein